MTGTPVLFDGNFSNTLCNLNQRMKAKILLRNLSQNLALLLLLFAITAAAQTRKLAQPRSVTIVTEPDAGIWLNAVNFGTTDAAGKLLIKPFPAGIQALRVRAKGFKEVNQNIAATFKGELKVAMTKSTDEAELAFQIAEELSSTDSNKALEFYRKAISIRPRYAEAFVGISRILSAKGDYEESLSAIANARKIQPIYPEASAVEGRIYKSEGEEEKAIESFKRAIREGRGFQPEANTGLALLYKEKAEFAGNEGDFEGETALYEESVKYFAAAAKQLSSSPDAIIVIQMYGLVLEKMGKNAEAIKVYQEFLRVFPDIPESASVRSFIVQLEKQMAPE